MQKSNRKKATSLIQALCVIGAVVLQAHAVNAPLRIGNQIIVNNVGQECHKPFLSVSPFNGTIVIAYEYITPPAIAGQQAGPSEILANVYDSTGAVLKTAFSVFQNPSSAQTDPSVFHDTDGTFIISWAGVGASGAGIYAKRFDISNSAMAGPFKLTGSFSSTLFRSPSIAVRNSGHKPICAYGLSTMSNLTELDSVFNPIGSDQLVCQSDLQHVLSCKAIGFDTSFGILTNKSAGSAQYVCLHILNNSLLNSEINLDWYVDPNGAGKSLVDLARSAQNRAVAVWDRYTSSSFGYDIYACITDTRGSKIRANFMVNSVSTDAQRAPKVGRIGNNGFMILWNSNTQDGSGNGVFGRCFDSLGNAYGDEFKLSKYTSGAQQNAAIGYLPITKKIITAWEDNSAIFAQVLYDSIVANQPTLVSTKDTTAIENTLFTYIIRGQDANGFAPELTQCWITSSSSWPAWLEKHGDTLRGVPLQKNDLTLSIVLNDGYVTDTSTLTIKFKWYKPVISSPASDSFFENKEFRYVATATDSSGIKPRIWFSALPGWLTARGDTVAGTPNLGNDTSFIVFAYDSAETTTQVVSLKGRWWKPAITSKLLDTATENAVYQYIVTATDSSGKKPSFTFTSKPSWLLRYGDTLRGMPTNANYENITIIASDGFMTDQQTLTIAKKWWPPQMTSPDIDTAFENSPFEYIATAIDSSGVKPSIGYAATRPAWLSVSGDTIRGKPVRPQDSVFFVVAGDGWININRTVNLKVKWWKPQFLTSRLDTIWEDVPFSFPARAFDSSGIKPVVSYVGFPAWIQQTDTTFYGLLSTNKADTTVTIISKDSVYSDTAKIRFVVLNRNDSSVVTIDSTSNLAGNVIRIKFHVSDEEYNSTSFAAAFRFQDSANKKTASLLDQPKYRKPPFLDSAFWNLPADVGSKSGNYWFYLTAVDSFGKAGTTDSVLISASFDHQPVIRIDSVVTTREPTIATVYGTVFDPDGNLLTLSNFEFTAPSQSWTPVTPGALTGTTSMLESGAFKLTWKTDGQYTINPALPPLKPRPDTVFLNGKDLRDLVFRCRAASGNFSSGWAVSRTFSIDNNYPPVVAVTIAPPEITLSPATINISINDAEKDYSWLFVQFREDSGSAWKKLTFAESTSVIPTTTQYFTWLAGNDVPHGKDLNNIGIRIRGVNFVSGSPDSGWSVFSGIHVDFNDPPVAEIAPIYALQRDYVQAFITVADSEKDSARIGLEYSFDRSTWKKATTKRETTKYKTPFADSVIWFAGQDVRDSVYGTVFLRACGTDNDSGAWTAQVMSFQLDTRGMPKVTIDSVKIPSDTSVRVFYTAQQSRNSSIVLDMEYDRKGTWLKSSNTDLPLFIDSLHYKGVFSWNAQKDLDSLDLITRIRLTPKIGTLVIGAADTSPALAFDFNAVPKINILGPGILVPDGTCRVPVRCSDREKDTLRFSTQIKMPGSLFKKDSISLASGRLFLLSGITDTLVWPAGTRLGIPLSNMRTLNNITANTSLRMIVFDNDTGPADTLATIGRSPQLVPTDLSIKKISQKRIVLATNKRPAAGRLSGIAVTGSSSGKTPVVAAWDTTETGISIVNDSAFYCGETLAVRIDTSLLDPYGYRLLAHDTTIRLTAPLLADFDQSGRVDFVDLALFFRPYWNANSASGDIAPFSGNLPFVKIRGDGRTDVSDISAFTSMWYYSYKNPDSGFMRVLAKSSDVPVKKIALSVSQQAFSVYSDPVRPVTVCSFDDLPATSWGQIRVNYPKDKVSFSSICDRGLFQSSGDRVLFKDIFNDTSRGELQICFAVFSKQTPVVPEKSGSFSMTWSRRETGAFPLSMSGITADNENRLSGELAGSGMLMTRRAVPDRLALLPVAPNPVRAKRMLFTVHVPRDGRVALFLINLQGKKVATVINGPLFAGYYQIPWSCQNGKQLSSGTYLYLLRFESQSIVRKMQVVR